MKQKTISIPVELFDGLANYIARDPAVQLMNGIASASEQFRLQNEKLVSEPVESTINKQ